MHQIAARILPDPCRPNLMAYCPTMDLVATVTPKSEQVDVSRLNGQRVFGAAFEEEDDGKGNAESDGGNNRDESEAAKGFVRALTWRRDGQILAVACADGSVSLVNAFTGKIAHRLSTRPRLPNSSSATGSFTSSQPRSQPGMRSSSLRSSSIPTSSPETRSFTPSCLSWTTHFTPPTSLLMRARIDQPGSQITLDHILGHRPDMDKLLTLKADLPRELSTLDVEASLPKLATLPPRGVGADDDVFSSRTSVDAVFHGHGATGAGAAGAVDGVDALLIGLHDDNGDGCAVHLRIFDSFEIGTVDVGGKVLRMECHPYLSTAFLVVEESRRGQDRPALHLVSLDLSFIPQTSRNLPLMAGKATQLGNLLRYISQVQMQLAAEVKAAFDLPARFLRNIDESLAEKDNQADFVYAAHHLAVTGDCDARFREWLVDEVGERGLKRWEKAVGDCLDVVRRMTSECLMPALERCLVVLSRLDGLARFGPASSRLGLDANMVRKVMETVDVLALVAEDLLLDVGVEIKEFAAFIKWLKWECEVEALEEGSERAEELRESWTGEAELKTVLDYVGGAIKESRVKRYTGRDGEEQPNISLPENDTDAGFYADFTKRRKATNKDKKTPTLGQLVERLQKQCEAVFGQIAETFRKSILASHVLELPGRCDGERMDLRIIPDENDATLSRLFILSTDREERGRLRQAVVTLRQDGGKGLKSTTSSSVLPALPEVTEIVDVKFVDDTVFLVLARTAAEMGIYARYVMPNAREDGEQGWEVRHIFEDGKMEAGMKPVRLEVNGRVGRRIAAVIEEAGMGYVVLDLDADVGNDQTKGTGDEIMTG
ncbi:hypothetical protein LTR10_023293 [Elasticomyces elasticus]|uniref:Anaphase-promoting complex subunit 4 n=1 Tax=Exophiala sideris TaxID=1016849 RepID=A0ABR0IZB4_9EURO|nr:hypothetical protein LTR10_023293 [Elasticomyces elasticus]KAK5023096.1 hypothetical protein LTS07_009590 [Exophiala sideris]KAK5026821.1 hypothetical protein LTR13_009862 [Exophiala sideris]KAK5052474.1 hypothetical protein LTR69_009813 [Exophiala sideris]KAK5178259.1 hypothetical protein LTR44_009344 [Eurotiomycetes sp. CCFEE 6388]